MDLQRIEVPFGAQSLTIETGKLAKQANAAVTVTCGGTVVLVTACMSNKPRTDINFFPIIFRHTPFHRVINHTIAGNARQIRQSNIFGDWLLKD